MFTSHTTVETFTHAGEEYEIRISNRGDELFIQAFKGNIPATPFGYTISELRAFDLKQATEFPAVQRLIQSAKNDIFEGNGDKLRKAMKGANLPTI